MDKKIGLNFWVGSKFSQARIAKKLGCDYIEVCLEYPFLTKKKNIDFLYKMKDLGLELAFESPHGAIQIFNPIPEVSKTSMKIMKRMLNFCEKFEPLYFNFHQTIHLTTYKFVESLIEKQKLEIAGILNKTARFPLTFENTPEKSLSTPEQFSFIREFDNLFLCLDVGHIPIANFIWKKKITLEDWKEIYDKKIFGFACTQC